MLPELEGKLLLIRYDAQQKKVFLRPQLAQSIPEFLPEQRSIHGLEDSQLLKREKNFLLMLIQREFNYLLLVLQKPATETRRNLVCYS